MSYEASYEPLLSAIREQDMVALNRYVTSGQYAVNADIPYRSEDGKHYIISPLYWAVKCGHREVCKYLLRKGADPWGHMVYEYYPLHEACNRGCAGVLQEFISAGVSLDRTNSDLDTPLHIACMRGHIECVKLLLSAGADRSLRNIRGQSPLETARFNGHADLCKLFDVFEKEPSTCRLRMTEPSVSKRPRQPQNCEQRRATTLGSRAHLRHRPLSLYDTFLLKPTTPGVMAKVTVDDTSIPATRLFRPNSGVNRAMSFTGRDRPEYATNPRPGKGFTSGQRPHSTTARNKLSTISHESQLILPTQPLIPDTKRTQTVHDFGPSLEHYLSTTTADELEVDHARRSPGASAVATAAPEKSRSRIRSLCRHAWEESQVTCPSFQRTRKRLVRSLGHEMEMDEDHLRSLEDASGKFCSSALTVGRTSLLMQAELYQEYELVTWQPVLVGQGLPAHNSAHMVFKVRLLSASLGERQGALAYLKVTVAMFNLESKEEAEQYHSGNYSHPPLCEGRLLERIPPHPHIAAMDFYGIADSKPFEKFTRNFCPEDGHMSLKMAPQAMLVCLRNQPNTLLDFFRPVKLHHPQAPFGMEESAVLSLLAELLLGAAHLDQHGAVLSCLQLEDVYVGEASHLAIGNLHTAMDLAEMSARDVRLHLAGLSEELLLLSPPELCHLADCPMSEVCAMTPEEVKALLCKCNSYAVGRLFLSVFAASGVYEKQMDQFEDCCFFSMSLNNLLRRLVSTLQRDRITAHEGAMWCLGLLYGPRVSEAESFEDVCHWLYAETMHCYLRPVLKGVAKGGPGNDQLLLSYLAMASAEGICNSIQLRTRDGES